MKNKKATSLMFSVIKQLIIISLLFVLFFGAANAKVNSSGVKQQVLEKQIALLIESAPAGATLEIKKTNADGFIRDVKIDKNRVFVKVDNLKLSNGYPFFSRYEVSVRGEESSFFIEVKDG